MFVASRDIDDIEKARHLRRRWIKDILVVIVFVPPSPDCAIVFKGDATERPGSDLANICQSDHGDRH